MLLTGTKRKHRKHIIKLLIEWGADVVKERPHTIMISLIKNSPSPMPRATLIIATMTLNKPYSAICKNLTSPKKRETGQERGELMQISERLVIAMMTSNKPYSTTRKNVTSPKKRETVPERDVLMEISATLIVVWASLRKP